MIGIIGAMEVEVELLKEKMEIDRTIEVAGLNICYGGLYGHEVALVRCGIGKVNAAICTQVLIDKLNVDTIICTGIAGAVSDKLEIGDIVISDNTLQWDVHAEAFNYPQGQIPQMDVQYFECDKDLVNKAYDAAKDAGLKAHIGRIVSGDSFVANVETKVLLSKKFKASCVEMEGAAIGQCAYQNKTKYVIIRAISDKADGTAAPDYAEFEHMAIENTFKLVKNFLEKLPN